MCACRARETSCAAERENASTARGRACLAIGGGYLLLHRRARGPIVLAHIPITAATPVVPVAGDAEV